MRLSPLSALLLLLPSCQVPPSRDLVKNEGLFPPIRYQARHRQTRRLFVAPLVDARKPLEAFEKGIYPISYTEDGFWERPVREMCEDLLRREIRDSGIFAGFAKDRESADWVLEVELTAFHGAVEERIVGRRSYAKAALHARVLGERGTDGKRPVLREKDFVVPVRGGAGLVLLRDPHALAAAGFRRCLAFLLQDLDQGGALVDGEAPRKTEAAPKRVVPWRARPASSRKDG